jgi:excisionase family DNA binding protein
MRAADPAALGAWYREFLGLDADENGLWHQETGPTVLATFESGTDYARGRSSLAIPAGRPGAGLEHLHQGGLLPLLRAGRPDAPRGPLPDDRPDGLPAQHPLSGVPQCAGLRLVDLLAQDDALALAGLFRVGEHADVPEPLPSAPDDLPCRAMRSWVSRTRTLRTARVSLLAGPARDHPGADQQFGGNFTFASWTYPRGIAQTEIEVVFFVFSAHDGAVDSDDLIRTGEAALILGCSRQHVVDLCDSGRLPLVRKGGSHRYVRRSDVLALVSRPLTREQEQSRWLHAAIASRLVAEPDLVLGHARMNLDRFDAVHVGTMAAHWLGLWRDALDAGPDQVLTTLTSETLQAAEMRQNSPFTGILPPDERRAVLESFQRHWRAGHPQ